MFDWHRWQLRRRPWRSWLWRTIYRIWWCLSIEVHLMLAEILFFVFLNLYKTRCLLMVSTARGLRLSTNSFWLMPKPSLGWPTSEHPKKVTGLFGVIGSKSPVLKIAMIRLNSSSTGGMAATSMSSTWIKKTPTTRLAFDRLTNTQTSERSWLQPFSRKTEEILINHLRGASRPPYRGRIVKIPSTLLV